MKKIYYILLLLCCTIVTSVPVYSQVTFGEQDDPDSDAVLDLRSNFDVDANTGKGLLLPRLSLVNVNEPDPLENHVAGMVIYNIAEEDNAPAEGYYFNDGFQWVQITDTQIASWFDKATDKGATSNLEDIYQTGAVYVGGSAAIPHTQFAVMSDTKGALMPRLSAQEIAAIPVNETPDGLLVFNTSSKCYNYFHGGDMKWVSICPEAAPSAIAIETCDGSEHKGTYKVGVTLTNANYYVLKVRVNEAGPYSLRVTTGNGYSFERSGTFTEPGVYTLNLPGQGTPVAPRPLPGGDVVSVFLNGTDVTADMAGITGCPLPYIEVEPADLQYAINCDDVPEEAGGDYMKDKTAVDRDNNKITIKVNVTTEGRGAVRTNTVNGVYFESDITTFDTQGEYSVILYAKGTPTRTGLYTFLLSNTDGTAGECSFEIDVITSLGLFESPAVSCLAILTDDPRKTDGEYWIQQSASATTTAVLTRCDMTNGGYTLVWTYSERTAYTGTGIYTPANNVVTTYYNELPHNLPQNVITSKDGSINYENMRLAKATMENIKGGSTALGDYRVRIAYDAEDVNDSWGVLNYIRYVPIRLTADFINGSGNVLEMNNNTNASIFEGMIFGIELKKTGTTITYNGLTAGLLYLYNTTYYASHWDFGHRLATGTRVVALPKHPDEGGTFNFTVNFYYLNNMFGWFGETNPNHHFGKCTSTGSDYNEGTGDNNNWCAGTRYVHAFNMKNGVNQGRYLQWWVK